MAKFSEKNQIKSLFPIKKSFQNKGDFGHVLVIGGSMGMAGAVCMSALSALKTGAGLVTAAVPACIASVVAVKLTECMVLPLPEQDGVFDVSAHCKAIEFSKKCNVIAIGMGARKNAGITRVLESLLFSYQGVLVVDADGLNVLADNPELLEIERKCELILTPHPGEMARLCNCSVQEVQVKREEISTSLAQKYGVVVVLKGENTVITDGDAVFINPTGNVGMATGGSGDVLTGIIAGFAAQDLDAKTASLCGCYVHGLSGDIAVNDKTVYCLTACDLIEYLPDAFKEILS